VEISSARTPSYATLKDDLGRQDLFYVVLVRWAMTIPRFRRYNLNPMLVQEDIGDTFQAFAYEVLRYDYPDLHFFPGKGKDGVIDLSQTRGQQRVVVECKFIGRKGLAQAQRRWGDIARKLNTHLADPSGPTKRQAQYRPWYRTDPKIVEFVFCISSVLDNQDQIDELQKEITSFFSDLSQKHEHLAHLGELSVRILDWNDLCQQLRQRPHLLFRWFPKMRPQGLVPLAEFRAPGVFRSYLTSEKLPYYSRRDHMTAAPFPVEVDIPDEEGLLALFEDENTTGLVVTGSGGVGKTRLTQEVASQAEKHGWLVLRAQGQLQAGALERLAEWITPETPVLVLLDYIEIQRDFAEVEQVINDLNDTYRLRLCYIASCRPSYYRVLHTSSRRLRIDLSPYVQDLEQCWLEDYRHGIVRHILEHGGIEITDRHLAVCQDVPIFAVFMVYLHSAGRETELAELLKEADFGSWVSKRVRLSFPHQPAISRDLALFVSLLPVPVDFFYRLDQGKFGDLLDVLANDGWVEKLPREEFGGSFCWTNAHDVLADQIVLSYIQDIPLTVERFVEEVFSLASEVGCVRSALFALQRVVDQPPLTSVDWAGVLDRKMAEAPLLWREARDLLVQTSLLTPRQRIHLLGGHAEVWDGAWEEAEVQIPVGWLARWVQREADPELDEAGHGVLRVWIERAAPHVTVNNSVLSWGLRLYPEVVRAFALDWIRSRSGEFQTTYLIRSWLECGFPFEEISAAVERWVSKFCRAQRFSFVARAWLDAGGEWELVRASITAWLEEHGTAAGADFVYKAWLDAGGERELVRDFLVAWLEEHGTAAEADFVYRAWLDAGGERELVGEGLAAWLEEHGTAVDTQFVYKAWLDGGGERELVRAPITAWLEEHGTAAEAGFVYKAWLDAGGERELVRDFLVAWLEKHGTAVEADFVYQAWLGAGGEWELVRDFLVAWLEEHGTAAEAGFVYKAWLDAGGERELVSSPITAWLEEHGTAAEARFVYKAWLDAGGERDLVRDFLVAWVEEHGTAAEARFVYKAWLDAGGERDLVRDFLVAWVEEHGTAAEAGFVYKAWLDAGGEPDLVRDFLVAWLEEHGTVPDADFLFKAWLQAGGSFSLVKLPAINWLHHYCDTIEAVYLTKFLAKQRDIPVETVADILTWCRTFPTHEDAMWRLTQLGHHLFRTEVAEDVIATCEIVLEPLLLEGASLEPVTRGQITTLFSYLIGASALCYGTLCDRVDALLITWLRNPSSFGTSPAPRTAIQRPAFVQRIVDLLASGDLSLTHDREHLERFLHWVNNWEPEQKSRLLSIFDRLRDYYPAADLWDIVEFP
jgi:hypothetical protein